MRGWARRLAGAYVQSPPESSRTRRHCVGAHVASSSVVLLPTASVCHARHPRTAAVDFARHTAPSTCAAALNMPGAQAVQRRAPGDHLLPAGHVHVASQPARRSGPASSQLSLQESPRLANLSCARKRDACVRARVCVEGAGGGACCRQFKKSQRAARFSRRSALVGRECTRVCVCAAAAGGRGSRQDVRIRCRSSSCRSCTVHAG